MSTPAEPTFEVFFDGQCPLCVREIRWLRRLDRRARIRFTDIAEPGFDASAIGVSRETLMARIHGRTLGGSSELHEGVEVFRRLYAAVGLERMVGLTRLPGIRTALELGYGWFARNRLWLTGREADCIDGHCVVPAAQSTSITP